LYLNQAEKMGLDTLSLQTFCKMISERAGHAQQVTRVGEKGAYELEEQFLQLEQTTARHGTHSWHIGHIDHTPLPLKFLLSDYADFADTVWLTVLSGGFDRKVRGFYLSFDEPSYRSCMMVIRDCVRRHGRMFQLVVSDGGSEFQSEYYESLLAWMGCHKRERLKGKPRYGSVCERLFRTQQTQFVSNLLGATGIVEQHFRAISPEVAPEKHAVWILDAFDTKFEEYTETIFHKAYHTGLDMTPDEAEARSLRSHGRRDFILRPYDDQFIAMTCPEIHRGDALVTPRGIKIKYLWFNDRALQQPGLLGTRVPGRYDPMNSGLGYAYVNQRWVPVRSERYAYFSTLTERAVRFASEALRLTGRKRGEKVQINAQSLARFLSTSEGEESIARQKRNDAEAAQHRAKNQTPHQPEPVALVEPVRGAVVVQMADHVANKASAHARQARRERRPLGEL
jgi:hypothetical protein